MGGHACQQGLGTQEEQERRGTVGTGQAWGTLGVSARGHGGRRGAEPLWCLPSIRSVMQKYLEDRGEVTFDKIFTQKIGEMGTQGLRVTQGTQGRSRGRAPTNTEPAWEGLGAGLVAAVTVVVAVAIPLCPWHGLGEARGLWAWAGQRCLGAA